MFALDPLPGRPAVRGLVVTLLLLLGACAPPVATDPAKAEIVTEDLARFWEAFDRGTDAATLQQHYLDRGSRYLQQFTRSRIASAERLSETVTRNRGYYESIRANTLSVVTPEWKAPLIEAFTRLEALDPDATFPPTAFVIGRMNAGGWASGEAILIGLELYSLAPDSPRDTLNDFEGLAVQSNENLVVLISHELVHAQQVEHGSFRNAHRLLEMALQEGVADFVGEKTGGRVVDPAGHAWGAAHEAQLWQEFLAEKDGEDHSRWLYNKGKDPDRPGDLGYFIGYRIAQAWARQQPSEAEAVRALLRVTDADRLLRESGYDGTAP